MREMIGNVLIRVTPDLGITRAARRNAWAAMSADAKRARQRAELAAYFAASAAAADPAAAAIDTVTDTGPHDGYDAHTGS